MTQIILKDIPDNYFDVFSSDYFNGSQERELNWLEKNDKQRNKKERDSKVHPTENGQEIIK